VNRTVASTKPTAARPSRYLSTWRLLQAVDRLGTTLPLIADCCAPVVGTVMSPGDAQTLATSLKAIADPVRLRLISLVAAHPDGEACVCELTEPVALSQPTVSHHLKILVDAGVLTREQRGKWAYYRLVPNTLNTISALIATPSSPAT
jgi:ArsR family transcriptional regulator, arsenate/arsenite/antimonite-responsive transcriptional repressor